jgi:hypothetical protein
MRNTHNEAEKTGKQAQTKTLSNYWHDSVEAERESTLMKKYKNAPLKQYFNLFKASINFYQTCFL